MDKIIKISYRSNADLADRWGKVASCIQLSYMSNTKESIDLSIGARLKRLSQTLKGLQPFLVAMMRNKGATIALFQARVIDDLKDHCGRLSRSKRT